MKIIEYNNIKQESIFLHYTSIKNIDSISKNGLLPKIGKNSIVIEKTKKVFFTEGEKGALLIIDVWIKWLIEKPNCKLIYIIGAYLLKTKFFPKIIHEIIMVNNRKSKKKKSKAFKEMNKILNDSVYLLLDLEENIDFSYDDIDEVKDLSNIPSKFINEMYPNIKKNRNSKIEYWNMRTKTNKIIEKDKISIISIKNSVKAIDIIKHLAMNNIEFIEKECFYLNNFLNDKTLLEQE